MRSAVLTALVSVALVTAVGALGAAVVGDAARDTVGDAPDPFVEGDGVVDPSSDGETDGGGLYGVRDAPLFRLSPGGETGNGGSTASGKDSGPAGPSTSDDDALDETANDAGSDDGETDSDGDGLPDDHERTIGTDPSDPDSDGDGIADARELEIGTDPSDPDSDGDGLLDGWEVAGETPSGAELPGADPLARDVYVQFDYARGIPERSQAFYDAVAARFAEMPVDNPDNSSGIRLHVREGGTVNDSVRFTGENFWSLKDRYYDSELGPRAGVYHQVLVVRFGGGQVGYGEVGGRFTVVAGDLGNETAQRAVTHELLHNVVGRVEAPGACEDDPRHYCEGGYLSPRFDPGEEQYLAEGLARQLERQGFAEP